MRTIKAISLWQPWASLCVIPSKDDPSIPVKPYETRKRSFSHRGLILIHAAKKWNRELEELCWREDFRRGLSKVPACLDFPKSLCLPLGCIVGAVEWEECYEVVDHVNIGKLLYAASGDIGDAHFDDNDRAMPTGDALAFGDFSVGRYAIEQRNPIMFDNPIPYRGAQGIFNVPAEVVAGQMKGRDA